jgi:hypothetical protein
MQKIRESSHKVFEEKMEKIVPNESDFSMARDVV